MLDGRVLGASQVEYNPFGERPLKRELELSTVEDSTSHCGQRGQPDLLRRHGAACLPSRRRTTAPGLLAICAICAIWVLHAKPLNPHSLRAPC